MGTPLANSLDQMDLALDQLAANDPNYDRFALMLVDNAVELILHRHAQDASQFNELWVSVGKSEPEHDPKVVAAALGWHFDDKVRLARTTGMISPTLSDTIRFLHSFRNSAYHKGLHHEGILHSLTLFYFQCACDILEAYKPSIWKVFDDDIPYRAMKYLGRPEFGEEEDALCAAWLRIKQVSESLGGDLVADLYADLESTINSTDRRIQFLADNSDKQRTRDDVVVDLQAFSLAYSDKGRAWASENGASALNPAELAELLAARHPWPVKTDPIPRWQRRVKSLENQKNTHKALKIYCDFMAQTDDIRRLIEEAASELDRYIQLKIDEARGK